MPLDDWYEFGRSEFKNFVWLKGGAAFKNPRAMDVETSNEGAFAVEVWYELAGGLAGKEERENVVQGWESFDFHGGTSMWPPIPDGMYRIRLVNLAPGTRVVKQGTVSMIDYHPWERLPTRVLDALKGLFR